MKGFAITLVAVVAGIAIYKWAMTKQASPAARNAHNDPGAIVSSIAPQGLYSGVPSFNNLPVANGHGDQVAAAYHNNALATLPGNNVYEPAFGPITNRGGGVMETF